MSRRLPRPPPHSWGIEDDANMTVRELQLRQSLSGTYFKRRREVTPPMTPDAGLACARLR